VIENLVGKRAAIEFRPPQLADVPATWANVAKARSVLEWAPQTRFDDGVRRLVEWYAEHRGWAKDIATV
jgi:UDP-glucuronate 4-epimerase